VDDPYFQRPVAVVALIVGILAFAFSLLPFKFGGAIPCEAPLFGAEAKTDATLIGYTRPDPACRGKGIRRMTTAAMAALLVVAAATAPSFIPPPGQDCRAGRHDDCRAWWPATMGAIGARMACKCRCHQAERQGKFRN
jgi:hypothetical protein